MTLEQLKKIIPTLPKSADVFLPFLNQYMEQYSINTKKRIAMFIAQIAHESGGFRYTTEIASGAVYDVGKLAVTLGNTPQDDGDGEFYKGRGLIQITGRTNYERVSKALGVDFIKHPELLSTPQYAVQSACWFWGTIKGNEYADLPDTWRSPTKKYSPLQYNTYRINGGQNGYADRLKYYNKALQVL